MEKLISRETYCVAGEFGVKMREDILMQRFRLLPAVVTISLASSALLAHADNDTPAQAAARAALMQQMNQMDAEQAPGSSNSVTAPVAPSNAPAAQSPPVAQPTPQFSTNVPVVTPPETGPVGMSDTKGMPETNVMPEASEPAMAEEKGLTNNTAAITLPPPSVLTNDASQYPVNPPMAPLPPPQAEAVTPAPTPTQTLSVTEQTQTHPVAVPMSGSGGEWPTPVPSNAAAQQFTPGMATSPGASLSQEGLDTNSTPIQSYAPINAPPLPISPEKQSELQNLLSRYMANQITPVQYQEERARIMAEP